MISCDFQGIYKGGSYLYVLFYENMHFSQKKPEGTKYPRRLPDRLYKAADCPVLYITLRIVEVALKERLAHRLRRLFRSLACHCDKAYLDRLGRAR